MVLRGALSLLRGHHHQVHHHSRLARALSSIPAAAEESSPGRLQYDHRYHAGSGVDCFKHIVLLALLKSMRLKPTPFSYVETHAGAGLYELGGDSASKLKEHEAGIGRLMSGVPDDGGESLIDEFMAMQRSLGSGTYLGSAGVARRLLREGDDGLLFERAADVHAALGESMSRLAPSSKSAALSTRCEDGYSGLTKHAKRKRKLPRGLVLVDPPYQDGSDTDQTLKLVRGLRRDWRSARLALWYPISDRSSDQMRRLENELLTDLDCDALRCELSVTPKSDDASNKRLPGSGFLIIQPPYKLDDELRTTLPILGDLLKQNDDDKVSCSVQIFPRSS